MALRSADRTPPIDLEPVIPLTAEAASRLQRLRRVAWFLDRSIPIGGGYRIGLDPIIGLIPGLGDWLGAALSLWVVHEGVRLGVPTSVVARMILNVVIEAIVGAFPVLGDLFDAAWQANQRNLKLVERHHNPQRPPHSLRRLGFVFTLFALLFLAVVGGLSLLAVRLLWSLIQGD